MGALHGLVHWTYPLKESLPVGTCSKEENLRVRVAVCSRAEEGWIASGATEDALLSVGARLSSVRALSSPPKYHRQKDALAQCDEMIEWAKKQLDAFGPDSSPHLVLAVAQGGGVTSVGPTTVWWVVAEELDTQTRVVAHSAGHPSDDTADESGSRPKPHGAFASLLCCENLQSFAKTNQNANTGSNCLETRELIRGAVEA